MAPRARFPVEDGRRPTPVAGGTAARIGGTVLVTVGRAPVAGEGAAGPVPRSPGRGFDGGFVVAWGAVPGRAREG
jgi:hypothetical protein